MKLITSIKILKALKETWMRLNELICKVVELICVSTVSDARLCGSYLFHLDKVYFLFTTNSSLQELGITQLQNDQHRPMTVNNISIIHNSCICSIYVFEWLLLHLLNCCVFFSSPLHSIVTLQSKMPICQYEATRTEEQLLNSQLNTLHRLIKNNRKPRLSHSNNQRNSTERWLIFGACSRKHHNNIESSVQLPNCICVFVQQGQRIQMPSNITSWGD